MISLEHLRDLCAKHWNPIGFPMANMNPGGDEHPLPADEYDSYLIHVQHLVTTGASSWVIASYLARVESEFMGITNPAGDKPAFIEAVRGASSV